jgi:hypothetical protein
MNLPEENSTAHIAFNTIGCNLFAFLGMMTGTFVSSLGGDTPATIMGLNFYAVQYTTLMRAGVMFVLGFILVKYWKSFTRDEDIKMIEFEYKNNDEVEVLNTFNLSETEF